MYFCFPSPKSSQILPYQPNYMFFLPQKKKMPKMEETTLHTYKKNKTWDSILYWPATIVCNSKISGDLIPS